MISRVFGLLMLLVLSPLFLGISVILLVTQGRPIFYKGARLGFNGKEFYVYKFRSMANQSEAQLYGSVVGITSDLKTPIGRILRATRLDELAQLWNLFKGDMALLGPRPMRESVYATMGNYPQYYKRLLVKPGLFGPAQILLPHGAPKIMRYRLFRRFYLENNDNISCKEFILCLKAIVALIKRIVSILHRSTYSKYTMLSRPDRRKELRNENQGSTLYRIKDKGGLIYLTNDDNQMYFTGTVDNTDTDNLVMYSKEEIPLGIMMNGYLATMFIKNRKKKLIKIQCQFLFREKFMRGKDTQLYLISYKASTNFNQYKLEKYFLRRSIC